MHSWRAGATQLLYAAMFILSTPRQECIPLFSAHRSETISPLSCHTLVINEVGQCLTLSLAILRQNGITDSGDVTVLCRQLRYKVLEAAITTNVVTVSSRRTVDLCTSRYVYTACM